MRFHQKSGSNPQPQSFSGGSSKRGLPMPGCNRDDRLPNSLGDLPAQPPIAGALHPCRPAPGKLLPCSTLLLLAKPARRACSHTPSPLQRSWHQPFPVAGEAGVEWEPPGTGLRRKPWPSSSSRFCTGNQRYTEHRPGCASPSRGVGGKAGWAFFFLSLLNQWWPS